MLKKYFSSHRKKAGITIPIWISKEELFCVKTKKALLNLFDKKIEYAKSSLLDFLENDTIIEEGKKE